MSMGLGANFDRAQEAYDNRLPPEEPDKIVCEKCEGTGQLPMSDCCEAEPTSRETVNGPRYCTECGEQCGLATCDKCKGEGEVYPEKEEPDPDPEPDDYVPE